MNATKTSAGTATTQSGGNVFADVGLAEPELLQVRALLLTKVAALIADGKMSSAKVASLQDVDPLEVSALLNGKLSQFSTERLMGFLVALGYDIDIIVKKQSKQRGPGRIQVLSAPG